MFTDDYSKEAFELLEEHDFDCDFRAIDFEDFSRVKSEIINLINNNIYSIKTHSGNGEIISFIE